MCRLNLFPRATLVLPTSISRSELRRRFPVGPLVLALACFGLSQTITAQDGDVGNSNTAEGFSALNTYITTGSSAFDNTAVGEEALLSNTTGSFNTATGVAALSDNTTGGANTATGFYALQMNTTAGDNTATGFCALRFNTTGFQLTAMGFQALLNNTTGANNTATGFNALTSNTTGNNNTADGLQALTGNTSGIQNTATGVNALAFNATGNNNAATGFFALQLNTGSGNTACGESALGNNKGGNNNIGLGIQAGQNLTTGSNNIDIGNKGLAGEAAKIRIGTVGTQTAAFIAGVHGVAVTGTAVVVSSSGQLGTAPSSARFKEAIEPMDKASEAILALKPVTFRYKHELDPDGIPQFGLVAEQVEKVNPDLVARDDKGKVYTVRYEAVNAMLLNEFLKEHRQAQEQKANLAEMKSTVAKQEALIAQQQTQIEALTATVQKVSGQLELNRRAPQLVENDQ